jgi:hypothetical protein
MKEMLLGKLENYARIPCVAQLLMRIGNSSFAKGRTTDYAEQLLT